jgi:hypothetical protein
MASAPLLGGTIEADDDTTPTASSFPRGNIGDAPNAQARRAEPVVLVPGTAAQAEAGIVRPTPPVLTAGGHPQGELAPRSPVCAVRVPLGRDCCVRAVRAV